MFPSETVSSRVNERTVIVCYGCRRLSGVFSHLMATAFKLSAQWWWSGKEME